MTEKKKEITERLEREFDVCDKHILRINEALEGLGVNIPMSADCYSNLTTEQVRCIDQFIFRFSKLQDSMGAKIFEILTYFIIYSFLGWIMESIVRSVSEKKIINTGFLKGPVCPIYGIGAIIMLLFLERYQNKPILLFFIAIIVLTTWEYLVGVLLEKIFHTKYWDYSEQKFNFQGRICLVNSICWGIL